MYRIYFDYFDGIDVNCVKANNENQNVNTGKCHVGEKSAGIRGWKI